MRPVSVVTWLWKPKLAYRSNFTPQTVNVLQQMVKRHYPYPHRFICVTDQTDGLNADIEVVPPWNDFVKLQNPSGPKNPSCYRRLRAFAPNIGYTFGERFVSLDLDCVITGDLTPVWDRPEPFVIWGDTIPRTAYNGSMFLLTAGARPQVWTTFDPVRSPQQSYAARCFGSDQGWLSFCLGRGEATWTKDDGVYSYRNEIMATNVLPPNARIVFFHGDGDPWDAKQQRIPWVQRCWV